MKGQKKIVLVGPSGVEWDESGNTPYAAVIRTLNTFDVTCHDVKQAVSRLCEELGPGFTWSYVEPKGRKPSPRGEIVKFEQGVIHIEAVVYLVHGEWYYTVRYVPVPTGSPMEKTVGNLVCTRDPGWTHLDGTPIDWEVE